MDAACAAINLADTVAFLRRAESYPEGTPSVEAIETHLSWVFLTGRHAYKLKKPVHDAFRDLRRLEARRENCAEEVRLNRRLARDVYIGVAALTCDAGALALEGVGEPVEWLVKMRRLPRHLMLDAAMRSGLASDRDLARLAATLVSFHRAAARAPLAPEAYRARLERSIVGNRTALGEPRYALDRGLVHHVAAAQLAAVEIHARALGERAAGLVEGHGDLRPEHVCLSDPPVVIDCLEFDRALRVVDPADEIAFLAMECTFLGERDGAERLLRAWRAAARDPVDARLVAFYQSCRAVTRAKLAAWHLHDGPDESTRRKWIGQARAYLELAACRIFNSEDDAAPSRAHACA